MTKAIDIAAPAERVFEFLSNPANLPKWAIHNVRSVKPAAHGWWAMDTPRGPGRYRSGARKEFGILDHGFVDAREGHWSVHARVVPSSRTTCVYMITFVRPEGLPTDLFEQGMRLIDDELTELKKIHEGETSAPRLE